MSAINQPNDRTFVYEDSPFQFVDNTGNRRLALIQNWNFTPNMADFDIDRIDTAAPIFTKKSDILGSFSFMILEVPYPPLLTLIGLPKSHLASHQLLQY